MREVILQNMMGRSVLPFPLSLQTKKHTGQCSNKDKAALVQFCCNCFNCLRSVRISDETTFQVVIINIYALKRFFFLKNFRPVPQFVLPITNFEDLSQDLFYPIREKRNYLWLSNTNKGNCYLSTGPENGKVMLVVPRKSKQIKVLENVADRNSIGKK